MSAVATISKDLLRERLLEPMELSRGLVDGLFLPLSSESVLIGERFFARSREVLVCLDGKRLDMHRDRYTPVVSQI